MTETYTPEKIKQLIDQGKLAFFPIDPNTSKPIPEFRLKTENEVERLSNLVDVGQEDSSRDLKKIEPHKVNPEVYEAFKNLKAEVKEEYGIDILINSGARTFLDQINIGRRFTNNPDGSKTPYEEVRKIVAPPGYSEHQTGLAIDITLLDDNGQPIETNEGLLSRDEELKKVHKKLAKYGFILRYPEDDISKRITSFEYEPWHFSYVGKEIAKQMEETGCATLEEFFMPETYNPIRDGMEPRRGIEQEKPSFAQGVFSDLKNPIIDYEQAQEILAKMVNAGMVKQEEDIGFTECGFPIEHYTIGEGENELLVTGAMHGSETITVDAVLRLMEHLSDKDLGNYKIHFIPMLNPEGYITSTSAIREFISRDMPAEVAEVIAKEYFWRYRASDIIAAQWKREAEQRANSELEKLKTERQFQGLPLTQKEEEEELAKAKQKALEEVMDRDPSHLFPYQEMFKDVDYTCIPDTTSELKALREKAKQISAMHENGLQGCIQEWSANGSGLDLQSATKFDKFVKEARDEISKLEEEWESCGRADEIKDEDNYSQEFVDEIHKRLGKRYSPFVNRHCKIDKSIPGPIGCGIDIRKGYIVPFETEALIKFAEERGDRLKGTLHLHSAMGAVFQRPMDPSGLCFTNEDILKKTISNYALAKILVQGTIGRNGQPYDIKTGKGVITSLNNFYNAYFNGDMLLELSTMGANPVGYYGDLNNHSNVINGFLKGYANFLKFEQATRIASQYVSTKYVGDISSEMPDDTANRILEEVGRATNFLVKRGRKVGRKAPR